jgi:hypothetical protein
MVERSAEQEGLPSFAGEGRVMMLLFKASLRLKVYDFVFLFPLSNLWLTMEKGRGYKCSTVKLSSR